MKDKSLMIEKLELALEKQQDGEFVWFGLACCFTRSVILLSLRYYDSAIIAITPLIYHNDRDGDVSGRASFTAVARVH